MKTVKIIIVAVLAFVFSSSVNAQAQNQSKSIVVKTETFKVSGNCDMCKTRIEKAAKIDGVTKAEWNKEDKKLLVTFDSSKTNSAQIGKVVAAAGHDNEKAKAETKVYDKLPACCKYR